jgi:phosphoglycerate mutase, BPG-dependent, family 1
VPPLLDLSDKRFPKFNPVFQNIDGELPSGESLKNVIDRLTPFWENYFNNFKDNNGNHLIVAHSNSLRAIVKLLDKLSDNDIVSVNIPTGVPLVYEFDKNFHVMSKNYLINKKELKMKQNLIVNQGKAK